MVVANNQIPRVAVYLRVSTEEQRKEGFSLAAQEDILKGYCESKGFEIYDVYNDGGYSGKDFNRPDMQRLLRDSRNHKFDIVLAVAVDRISRDTKDVLTFIDNELHPRGQKLLISTCDIDSSTHIGKMFISLLGTFAEYERKLIVDRVKNGMEKRASKGLTNGGRMLGYDSVDGNLVVNEDEAAIVKEIFELRAHGKGYKTIVNTLNGKGKKTKGTSNKPGKNFTINGVKTILSNEKYTGNMSWGKVRDWSTKRRKGKSEPTVVSEAHEAIIDLELWDKVQTVNKLNKEHYSNTSSNLKGEFILTGLLRCPVCGAGTVMSKSKKRDGSGYYLNYMCQTFHSEGKAGCGSNLIKKEVVEEQVLTWVRTMLADEEIVDEILDRLEAEESIGIGELKKDLSIQQNNLKKLLEQQEKQDADYFAGEIRAALYNRLSEELEIKIDQSKQVIANLERGIEKLQSSVILNKDIIVDALKNFDALFAEASNDEKRALLRALIKEIHMEADRKSIKNIVFWFTEDDSFSHFALPVSDVQRTVSQIVVKWKAEITIDRSTVGN
ncbi:recombinase family protein [Brevibacillus panacihumi]|uniref:recombinase family protein n=1 Tax=Brevibacillus panacihumi TaxID=497735 RepID=UPI003D018DD3